MNRGSLPPDQGSVYIEMFAPPLGWLLPPVQINWFPVVGHCDHAIGCGPRNIQAKEQTEEIFLLTSEVQTLCRKLALDFIQLSHQEVLFHMGVQAARYEKATWGCPHCAMAYYSLIKCEGEGTSDEKLNEATECLREAGGVAWLDTNSLLFGHALEYQNKMIELITSSREAIQALHECI